MSRSTVGIIGTGWIGRQHAERLARREDVVVGAVCDLDPSRAAAFGDAFGARVFEDWRTMLSSGAVDRVFICTPPRSHREPALAAFELGVPVYLEKPIARTLHDAREIVAGALEHRAVCAIGYQWHALEVLDDLRGCLEGQSIGCMLGVSIGPTAARGWFLDREAGGGNLLERGSHHIDLVRVIAGEVRTVQAASGKVLLAPRSGPAGDIDDAVTLVLGLESGAIATVVVAWTRDGLPGTYGVEVVASEGMYRVELDPEFRLTGTRGGERVEFVASEHPSDRSISRFLDAARLADPGGVFCTPADAIGTLAVAVAAEEALESGRSVAVK